MGVFNWFKKEKSPNDNFTAEDREFGQRVKEQQRELKQKRQELAMATEELRAKKEQMKLDLEIKKLEQELSDYEDDDEDDIEEIAQYENPEDAMLMTLLNKVLPDKNPQPPALVVNTPQNSPTVQVTQGAGVSFSDDQIKQYVGQIPKKNLLLVKTLDDEGLKCQILNIVPNCSADTLQKIMIAVRNA